MLSHTSFSLSDLPTEVLRDIFYHCDPSTITATCRHFAAIAHTTRSFWSSINLRSAQFVSDGPKHLLQRLRRAGISPLRITIGPIYASNVATPLLAEICQALVHFSSLIKSLEITTETSLLAGTILCGIFPDRALFPSLENLSIRVESEPDVYVSKWPHLDVVLEHAIERFPMLRVLAITTFDDCIPLFPELSSFAHLHTLILDGSLEQGEACIGSIVAVLYSTPRLETLWLKHFTREQSTSVLSPILPGMIKGREIHIPVPLPHLTTLSIAVPGCGTDIILCIDVPALRELHIDGSRGPIYGETERPDFTWSDWDATSVFNSLKHLANQSKRLHRLAITSTYLTTVGWTWLLFGEGLGPPFPELESLALHGLNESSGEIPCGFDDFLLLRYSREPSIRLHRLVLLQCTFPLSGAALAQAFENTITQCPSKSVELVFDHCCPQVSEDELSMLVNTRMRLSRRQVKEDEWWTHGHRINASDSHVY